MANRDYRLKHILRKLEEIQRNLAMINLRLKHHLLPKPWIPSKPYEPFPLEPWGDRRNPYDRRPPPQWDRNTAEGKAEGKGIIELKPNADTVLDLADGNPYG